MHSFKDHLNNKVLLVEKNTHLEHIEDGILNRGIPGAHAALNTLESLARKFSGGGVDRHLSLTTKWDGSPAIVVGTHPENGKFFIGTKSVFNKKNPKIIYSREDIKRHYKDQPGLAQQLENALDYLPSLGIKGVLQGDIMFGRNEVQDRTIDGQTYTTFKPNTILYAIPSDSTLADKIRRAKLGIIFHTTYAGDTLQSMQPSFKVDLSQLKQTHDVWFDDATYQDESGTVSFSEQEREQLEVMLHRAEAALEQIHTMKLHRLLADKPLIATLKMFTNEQIRGGQQFSESFVDDFKAYAVQRYATDKKKSAVEQQIDSLRPTIEAVLAHQAAVNGAKLMLIKKLHQIKTVGTFVPDGEGFKVVSPEGFVAVDHLTNNAVKLVDRLEFSRNNMLRHK